MTTTCAPNGLGHPGPAKTGGHFGPTAISKPCFRNFQAEGGGFIPENSENKISSYELEVMIRTLLPMRGLEAKKAQKPYLNEIIYGFVNINANNGQNNFEVCILKNSGQNDQLLALNGPGRHFCANFMP